MVGYLGGMLVCDSRHLMQSDEIVRPKRGGNDDHKAQMFMAWAQKDCRPLLCLVKSKNQAGIGFMAMAKGPCHPK